MCYSLSMSGCKADIQNAFGKCRMTGVKFRSLFDSFASSFSVDNWNKLPELNVNVGKVDSNLQV